MNNIEEIPKKIPYDIIEKMSGHVKDARCYFCNKVRPKSEMNHVNIIHNSYYWSCKNVCCKEALDSGG